MNGFGCYEGRNFDQMIVLPEKRGLDERRQQRVKITNQAEQTTGIANVKEVIFQSQLQISTRKTRYLLRAGPH